MEGKDLYSFSMHCTQLQLCCHKNVNRIIELMCEFPKLNNELSKFSKCCLVMEKLCDYMNNCCCNSDKISKHSMSEYKMKCSELVKICYKLNKDLNKKKSDYIRCTIISKLCKGEEIKNLKLF